MGKILLLLTQVSFRQEQYLPGYVITLPGDTVPGLIDYRNWEYNPDKISFQSEIKGEKTVVYRPLDIQGFGVHDERYLAAIVSVDVSTYGSSELPTNAEPDLITDTTL